MLRMILLCILVQVLFLNSFECQTTVNDSVILSGSLHHLNQSLIIELIISGHNFTNEEITSSENTAVSETTTNLSTGSTQSTSNETGVPSTATTTSIQPTTISPTSQTNGTTSSSNSSAIMSSTESTVKPSVEPTTEPTTVTTTQSSGGSTIKQTISTTISSIITTTGQANSTGSGAAPIVLPTTETSEQMSSTSEEPNSSTGSIHGSTLPNMYPQDLRYSCPRAVNGCSGPKSCLYAHPDCHKFFHCNDGGQAFVMNCPSGLEWNDQDKICDLPENAGCSSLP